MKRKELLNIINRPFEGLRVKNDRGLDVNKYKQFYNKNKTNAVKLLKPFQKAPIKTGPTAIQKLKANPGVGHAAHRATNKVAASGIPKTQERKEGEKDLNKVKTKSNAAVQNKEGSELKTGTNATKETYTVQNGKGSGSETSQNNKTINHSKVNQRQDMKVSERPKGTDYGPPLQDENNLRSLERTLDKGGFAHKVKDGGEIQTGEREIKINDWKEQKNVSEQR